jgi:hypothetical protein
VPVVELDAEALARCVEHAQTLRHDFYADAIAWYHCDPVFAGHVVVSP